MNNALTHQELMELKEVLRGGISAILECTSLVRVTVGQVFRFDWIRV